MRKSLLHIALTVSLFLLLANKADAGKLQVIHCVCEEYQSAAAVFVATVTDVKRADRENIPTVMISGFIYSGTVVSMRIEEAFKGVKETNIIFTQRGDFETCAPFFTTGERWLIYAMKDPDSFALHPMECSRSAKVEFAGSDLRYLRALPEIANKTRLSGAIEQFAHGQGISSQFFKHLSGVRVTVTSPQGQSYEDDTDGNGVYEFVGLPAGKYKVHADIPKPLSSLRYHQSDREVTLAERGCAEANMIATSTGSISGKVIDEDGRLIANLKVSLISTDKAKEQIQYTDTTWKFTDQEGLFEINELPPGTYVIGVNLDSVPSGQAPFPRTFYPGVATLRQAEKLVLGEGETIADLSLQLPKRLATRVIEGTAFFSDGQVVTQGCVDFSDSDKTDTYRIYATGKIGEDGRFSIRVLQGAMGWLHAYGSEHPKALGFGLTCVMLPRVEVIEDMKNLKIIIPLPNDQ